MPSRDHDLKIDKRFKDLIPPLSTEEFQNLQRSILAEGVRDSIVVCEIEKNHFVIDGFHRLAISRKHKIIRFPVKILKHITTREQAERWMVENQLSRRNLNPFQKYELVQKIAPDIEKRAKDNMRLAASAKRGQQISVEPINTQQELAKLTGVSHDSIAKAKVIHENGDNEIKEMLRQGEVSLNTAYLEVKSEIKRKENGKAARVRKSRMRGDLEGVTLIDGNALEEIAKLKDFSIDCIITSPPYWNKRDSLPRNHRDKRMEIGTEKSPEKYIEHIAEVFTAAYRKLKDTGTIWINLDDTYFKKERLGLPWKIAFELQKAGFMLRADIIYEKPNTLPDPVKDRPTISHEYLFMFTKTSKYFYDAAAIAEPFKDKNGVFNVYNQSHSKTDKSKKVNFWKGVREKQIDLGSSMGANKRSVWRVPHERNGMHHSPFPEKLIEPCVLAGCAEGGTIFDPFSGSGTTGVVAVKYARNYIGVEINPKYNKAARQRLMEHNTRRS